MNAGIELVFTPTEIKRCAEHTKRIDHGFNASLARSLARARAQKIQKTERVIIMRVFIPRSF